MQTRAAKTPIAVCCRASRRPHRRLRRDAPARCGAFADERRIAVRSDIELFRSSPSEQAAGSGARHGSASSRRTEAALEFRDLQRIRRWSVGVNIRLVDVVVMVLENIEAVGTELHSDAFRHSELLAERR